MKFGLGMLVNTIGVNDFMEESSKNAMYIHECLGRYRECDWGEMCEEDKEMNDLALKEGGRIFASYEKEGMPKIWIITEWDRSVTTILFPSEY
jgi:hypothetical protein